MENQKPPLRVDANVAVGGGGKKGAATFIFLHGYGDDAEGFISELLYTSVAVHTYSTCLPGMLACLEFYIAIS
jgi:predicted esterase